MKRKKHPYGYWSLELAAFSAKYAASSVRPTFVFADVGGWSGWVLVCIRNCIVGFSRRTPADDSASRDPIALSFGRGHAGRRAEGFLLDSRMTMRESSHVGGLGLTMESDTAHGAEAFVCLSGIA